MVWAMHRTGGRGVVINIEGAIFRDRQGLLDTYCSPYITSYDVTISMSFPSLHSLQAFACVTSAARALCSRR